MGSHQKFLSPFLLPLFLFLFLGLLLLPPVINSTDTITPVDSIKDGQTLISSGGNFALGFFSPGNSKNRYVGIWYNKVTEQTVVWVANRESPTTNSTGVLAINGGDLVLSDGQRNVLWSTNSSTVTNYSAATLLDSGNLVLRDKNERSVWESFDYPTHTLLAGMRLGMDRRTGLTWVLTSWNSPNDPARGNFSFGLDPRGMPQYFLMKGQDRIWRSGPWNGERFSGIRAMTLHFIFNFRYVANDDEIYYTYRLYNSSIISMMVLDTSGELQRLTWNDESRRWNRFWWVPEDSCDPYGACGAYGSCDGTREPTCECLRGFEPKSARDWSLKDWSSGCVRRRPLDCSGKEDGFFRLARVKLPDTSNSRVEPGLSLKACEEECLKNCSCTAYASSNISEGASGCVMWDGSLIDLNVYSVRGQDIYVRVDASDLDESTSLGRKKRAIIASAVTFVAFVFMACGYCWWRKAKGFEVKNECDTLLNENDSEEIGKGNELPMFDFGVVAAATDNFSEANKLGKGGFGIVYKGRLHNGQEVAVKRLSINSGQGTEEFKNEVILIAKLQHRNLVRLLGCCIAGKEKMLIYEYMPNKSLDTFIFDQSRRVMIDWKRRYNIIMGIARGVLYLHEDSRLRIIHRDLKVSNVLLDIEMNPKISDFGMARIVGGDQTQANTNRVVGTYGYMSPEYAMDGLFSVKSDAFSFGVLLLEIISGRRNNNYSDDCPSLNLIGHAWELWQDGRVLELVDSSMSENCPPTEALRCIQVGLLCVQENAEDRPNMSTVVFMLGNETTMPSPNQPAFCLRRGSPHPNSTSGTTGSTNDVTITEVSGR